VAWRRVEQGKREETDEGARGFIGERFSWRRGKGLEARGDRRAGSAAVHAQVSWPELGDDLTGGPHLSVSRERGNRYPFGSVHYWASGRNQGWARWFPHGPFPFLISFSFLYSVF
jgi:hypothetical protein